jgi:2-dehydro-3-deoxygluconokinase
VITNNADETILYDGENLITVENIPVNLIDPIGAGDAFMAGFIKSIFSTTKYIKKILSFNKCDRRKILEQAIRIGNICGSLTCTRKGDTSGMPTIEEIDSHLQKYYYNI